MNTIILICGKFGVKPFDIAKKKRGDIKEYTYKEILDRILYGEGNLAKDFPEFSKDTTAALLKKLFPGKTRISQPWRAFLLETTGLKRCSKCGEIKEHKEFSANTKEPDGFRAYCRQCSAVAWKAHYEANPEIHRERAKEYYKTNKEERLEYSHAYYHANPDLYAAHRNKRRTREDQALANWANLEEINTIYICCPQGHHVDHIIPLQGKLVCGLHTENNLQYLLASDNLAKSNSFDIDTHTHILEYVPPYGTRP